jgi:hypothetical protein
MGPWFPAGRGGAPHFVVRPERKPPFRRIRLMITSG